jgi:hypothetical protein
VFGLVLLSRRLVVVLAVIATTLTSTGLTEASAGPAPGLCVMNTSRGSVPATFAIDGCVDGNAVWLRNTLPVPITLSTSGSAGTPAPLQLNQTVAAVITRAYYGDPKTIMPGDEIKIPVGSAAASVSIASTSEGGVYALATAFFTYAGAVPVAIYNSVTTMIVEINDDLAQYSNCKSGASQVKLHLCQALLTRNVAFAVGRAGLTAVAKGLLALFTSTFTFLQWADAQPAAIGKILGSERTIRQAALNAGANIVGNNAAYGGGAIQTYDLSTGSLIASFVPDGANGSSANGRAVEVVGNEIYYSELSSGFGPSDGIHVAPYNSGAGGADLRVLPNPDPSWGIQDLAYSHGTLYALTGYGGGSLQVWGLDPSTGAVTLGPISVAAASDADGFTVLPDGNFLINSGDAFCTYDEYSATTGQPTGSNLSLSGSNCTGVTTDGTYLYLQTGWNSFTITDLNGNVQRTVAVAGNLIEDVSLG